MKYSLSNYILTVKCNDDDLNSIFGEISIGGEGSYLDTMSVQLDNDLFSMETYATGDYVHNKNVSRAGKVSLSLNQLSTQVAKLKRLCNFYYGKDYDGLTLTLNDMDGQEVASCIDCFPQTIPSQEFGQKANTQNWTFLCGKITFAE